MLRSLGIFCCCLLLPALIGAGDPAAVHWLTDYEAAQNQAQKEGKLVLIDFAGSDWCANCIRLEKEVFESEAFQAFAREHLVLVRADFPIRKKNRLSAAQVKHNEALAERYNREGAFPKVVILDAKGSIIGQTGYRSEGASSYVAHLQSLIAEP